MEFLTTPDLSRWPNPSNPSGTGPTPSRSLTHPLPTPSAQAHRTQPAQQAQQKPNPSPFSSPPIPSFQQAHTPQVDHRTAVKNTFQSLFSPSTAPTPSFPPFHRPIQSSHAPGLTPFLGPVPTPSLVPPNASLFDYQNISSTPAPNHPMLQQSSPQQTPENALSSPYLAAAAKEAVRREFMNMPAFASADQPQKLTHGSAEGVTPGKYFSSYMTPSSHDHHQVPTQVSAHTTPSPQEHHQVPTQVSPTSGDAKVPTAALSSHANVKESPKQVAPASTTSNGQSSHDSGGLSGGSVPRPISEAQNGHVGNGTGTAQVAPHGGYYVGGQGGLPPQGMVMMGAHGQMMMPGMYMPPGMMMYGGYGGQGMMMPNGRMGVGGMPIQPAIGGMVGNNERENVGLGGGVKSESGEEKKSRIEREKQDLIREFKKKTREAALVRFRQKRRERRFGKLIRYDCRKKLADARPRVKGRFVRIKEDEDDDESPQVVPGGM